MQSPEGDWADCDREVERWPTDLLLWSMALQSPEGDWADCDVQNNPWIYRVQPRDNVAIPRRGLG